VRRLPPVWDGDQGPIMRFPVRDGANLRDLATATVEVYIENAQDGTRIGMRPGYIVGTKASGAVDVMLKGAETDWGGLGAEIVLIPRFYYAQTMAAAGAPATNLLANASFDTDGNADGVADSWSLQGAKTATWAVGTDDPAPPVIYGAYQAVTHAALTDPDYIQQVLAPTLAPGDVLSVGCWHRSYGGAGEAASNGHALFFHLGATANSYAQLRVGDNDWYFTIGSVTADAAYVAATMGIDLRGTTLSNRLDEAFAFVGRWYVFHGERKTLPVRASVAVSKNSNQIAGVGGFEQDSVGAGFPDAWSNQAPGVTFSIEKAPANVSEGRAALKVVLTNQSANRIRLIWPGKYLAGETWRVAVASKTSGALTPGGGTGGYAVQLATERFDGPVQTSTLAALPTNAAAYADTTADLALTADRNRLIVDVYLNGETGTAWLDNVRLFRVTP